MKKWTIYPRLIPWGGLSHHPACSILILLHSTPAPTSSPSCTPPLPTASSPLHSNSKVHWSIDKTLSQRREGGQTYIPTVLPTLTEFILLHYFYLCLWVAFPVSCLSAGANGMEAKSPGFKILLGSQPSLHELLLTDTSLLWLSASAVHWDCLGNVSSYWCWVNSWHNDSGTYCRRVAPGESQIWCHQLRRCKGRWEVPGSS